MKTCKSCNTERALDLFPPRKKRGGIVQTNVCQICIRDRYRESARLRMAAKRTTPEGLLATRAAVQKCKKNKQRRTPEVRAVEYAERRELAIVGRHCKIWNNPKFSQRQKAKMRYKYDRDYRAKVIADAYERAQKQLRFIGIQIRAALNRGGNAPQAERFLGHTIQEIRDHLEAGFSEGMTWERFHAGEIHIDHIKPLRLFLMHDPDELRRAWALSNLQPLWGPDNLEKGGKYPEE